MSTTGCKIGTALVYQCAEGLTKPIQISQYRRGILEFGNESSSQLERGFPSNTHLALSKHNAHRSHPERQFKRAANAGTER